jgi:enamine deaminase RidA (YjgF/YER057c/UK114 family)
MLLAVVPTWLSLAPFESAIHEPRADSVIYQLVSPQNESRTISAMQRRYARSGSPYEDAYGFSRGVAAGGRIEIAGTAPVPPPGEAVAATAYQQMLRCGEIAIAALQELGASAGDVVRTRMYITDAADADEIGRAHAELFGIAAPAATMVVVAALLDPEWKVEIEVEAQLGD